jgi:hypothetical protein
MAPIWLSTFLEKDKLFLTNLDILCRNVLFNFSPWLVCPFSVPIALCLLLGISELFKFSKNVVHYPKNN